MVLFFKRYLTFIFLTFFLALSIGVKAQSSPPDIVWEKNFGSSSDDRSFYALPTSDGGFLSIGYAYANTTNPPSGDVINSKGEYDVFIVKTDKDGVKLWAKSYGGFTADYGVSAVEKSNGNYLILAETQSSGGDLTGVTRNASGFDIWLFEIDSAAANNHNIVWQKTYGGDGNDRAFRIEESNSNLYFIAGTVEATSANTGTVGPTKAGIDLYILTVDGLGNIIDSSVYGGLYDDQIKDLSLTSDGGCIITASVRYESASSFNNYDVSFGYANYDAWFLKLDANLNKSWDFTFGSSDIDHGGTATEIKNTGEYLIVGNTYNTDGIGNIGGVGGNGSSDLAIGKLNNLGKLIAGSVKKFGGNGYEYYLNGGGFDKIISLDTGFVILGTTSSINSGDFKKANKGSYDLFLLSLYDNGDFRWYQNYGGNNIDAATSLHVLNKGTGFIASSFTLSSSSGDINGVSNGNVDHWLVKFCHVTDSTKRDTVCQGSNYTGPSGKTYTNIQMSFRDTLLATNKSGCDSNTYTIVTMIPISATVTQTVNTLEITETGAYKWLNCNNSNNAVSSVVPSQTGKTFTPTVSGNYAVEITINRCVDTSTCTLICLPDPPTVTQTRNTLTTTLTGVSYQWLSCDAANNVTPIAGETSQSFTPTASGSYALQVTRANTCIDTSTCIFFCLPTPPTITQTRNTLTTSLTGVSYQWLSCDAANNVTPIAGETSQSFTPTASGSYALQVTRANTCIDTSTCIFFCVPDPPTVTQTRTALTTALTGVSYQWLSCDAANNVTPIAGETSQSFTPTASGSYALQVTRGNTCIDTSTCIFFCLPTPPTVIQTRTTLITALTGVTYQWLSCDAANNVTPIAGETSQTFTPTASGSYALQVTRANTCIDTSTCIFFCFPDPPTVTQTRTTLTTALTGVSYQWLSCDAANNVTPIAGQTSQSFTPTASGSYALQVTRGNNCVDTSTCIFFCFPDPPTITQTKTTLSSTLTGVSYQWLSCDAANNVTPIAGQTSQSFTPTVSGSYALQVTRANNCVDTSTCIFFCFPNPPTITQTRTTLSSTITGATYQWLSCDAVNNVTPIAGQTSQTFTPTASGSYALQVTITNTCVDTSTCIFFCFPTPPTITKTRNTLTTALTGVRYQWLSCDAANNVTPITGETSQSFIPTASGNYALQVIRANNCVDTSSCIFFCFPDPPTIIQTRTTLSSTITGTGVSYQWLSCDAANNVTPIAGQTSQTFTPTVSGSYALQVTRANTCVDTSVCILFCFLNPPTITKTRNTLTTTLTGVTYQWLNCDFANNVTPIAGQTSQTFTPTASGSYALQVTRANNCADTSSCIFFCFPNPPTIIKTRNTLTTALNGVIYQWLSCDAANNVTPITGETSQTFTPTASGNYALQINRINGCIDTSSCIFFCFPTPPTITKTRNTLTTTLTGVSYQWLNCDFANNVTPIAGETSQSFTPTASGNYALQVTRANTCVDTSICIFFCFPDPPTIIKTRNTLTTALNGVIYQWLSCDAANNVTPITGETSQSFTPTASGNYALQINRINGCIDTSSCIFFCFPDPPTITKTRTTLTTTLTGVGYQWLNCDAANNVTPITGQTSQTFTPTASGSYALQVTRANTCIDTSICIFFCFPSPPTIIKTRSTLTTALTGVGYQWLSCDAANNVTPIAGQTSQSFTPTASGNYALQVSRINGCIDTSVCIFFCFPDPPTVTRTRTTLSSTITGATYQWLSCDVANNVTPIAGQTSQSFTPTASGSYALQVTRANNCVDTSVCIFFCFPSPPTITKTRNTLTTTLTGVTYQWLSCDAANNVTPISGQTSQTFIPTASGSYALQVTRANNCIDTSACIFFCFPSPPTIIKTRTTLTTALTGVSYQWLNCDAANNVTPISGQISQTFTPTASGSYALQIIRANTCIDTSVCIFFCFPDPPTITKTRNTLTTALTGVSYQWLNCDFANNVTPIAGQTSQTFTPTASGSYALQVTRGNNCVDTSSCIFFCFPDPPTIIKTRNTLTTALNGVNYQWLSCDAANNVTPIAGQTSQSFTPTASGNYALQISRINGCIDTSSCIFFCFPTPPTITKTRNTLTTTLTGVSYQWLNCDFANNVTPIAGQTSQTFTPTASGSYALQVTRANTCVDTSVCIFFCFPDPPTITKTRNTLTTALTGVNYQWLSCDAANNVTPITGQTSQTFTPTASGNYALQISRINGCIDTSVCIFFCFPDPPTITKTRTTLTTTLTGVNYQWLSCDAANNVTPIAGQTSQIFTPTASGSYALQVTRANTCADTSVCIFFCFPDPPTITKTRNTLTTALTGVSYQWLSCDAANNVTPITGQTSQSFTPTASGNYALQVTRANTCADTSACIFFCFPDPPTVTRTRTTLSSTITGATYQWLNCDAANNVTPITGQTSQSFTPPATGNYALQITRANNCVDTSICASICFPSPPTIIQTRNTLTTALTGVTYQWLSCDAANNVTPITGQTSQSFIPTASGNYALQVTRANTCVDTSICIFFCFPDPPTITRTRTTLSSTLTGATYQWLSCDAANNVTPIAGQTSQSFTPPASGSYALQVTRANNCIDTSACIFFCFPSPPTVIQTRTTLTTALTGVTYQWLSCDAANNVTPIAGQTSQSFTPTASGNYALQVTRGNNCVDTSICIFFCFPDPPTITQTRTTLSSTLTGATYQWLSCDAANNVTPIAGQTSQSFTPTTSGSYALQVTRGNTCVDTSACIFFCFPTPPTVIQTRTTLTTALNGVGYQWLSCDAANNVTPITGQTTQSFTPTASGSYALQVTRANTCVDTSICIFFCFPTPPPITQTRTTLTTTLTGATYQWLSCDATNNVTPIAGQTSQSFTPTASGSYALQVTRSNNCVDTSACIFFCFPTPPTVIQTRTTLTTSLNGVGYQWLSCDAANNVTPITGQTSQTFTPTASGSYALQVTRGNGCIDTSICIFFCFPTPPTITQTRATITTALTGATYQWLSCDAANNVTPIAGQTSQTFIPTASGNYALQVTRANNCIDTSICIFFCFPDPPTITQTRTTLTTALTGATYQWLSCNAANNVTPITGQTSQTFTPIASGSYALQVTRGNNCVDTSACIFFCFPSPPNITQTRNTLTTALTGVTYQWLSCDAANNVTPITGETSQSFTPTASGSYALQVTRANNCIDTSTCIFFCFPDPPTITKTRATITTALTGATYQWLSCNAANNVTPIAGQTSQTFTPTASGNYALQVTRANNCVDTSACIFFCFPDSPIITQTGTTLTTALTGVIYQWLSCDAANNVTPITGETSQSFTPTASGSYALQVTRGNGCIDTSICIFFCFSDPPMVTKTRTTLTTTLTGVSYQWLTCDFANNVTPITGETSQSFTPPASGNYALQVTRANNCVDTSVCIFFCFPSPPTITQTGNTLTTALTGVSYRWLSCDAANNVTPIAGQTNQSFTTTTSGSYALQVTRGNGCIDTSICVLTCLPDGSTHTVVACVTYTWVLNGNRVYTRSNNTDKVTVKNRFGCDSIVSLNLTINPIKRDTTKLFACEGRKRFVFPSGKVIMNISKDETEYQTNPSTITGCDSIHVTIVTLIRTKRRNLRNNICYNKSFTSGGGKTVNNITINQTVIDTFKLSNGCDSLIFNILTVLPIKRDTQIVSACQRTGSYTFLSGNTVNPVVRDVLDSMVFVGGASNGCDSIFYQSLKMTLIKRDTQRVDACEGSSYTFPSGKTVNPIRKNEIDSIVRTGSNGCDSVFYTLLTMLPIKRDTIRANVCEGGSYTLPGGRVVRLITNSFNDIQNFTASNGCDSIVFTIITVIPLDRTNVNASVCRGENFTNACGKTTTNITKAFNDVCVLQNRYGCDSTVTTSVSVIEPVNTIFRDTICEGENYTFPSGRTLVNIPPTGAVGIDEVRRLKSVVTGCDSIHTITLIVLPNSTPRTVNDTICYEADYTFPSGKMVLKVIKAIRDTSILRSANGCDSTIYTNLSLYKIMRDTIRDTICEGSDYTFIGGNTKTNITKDLIDTNVYQEPIHNCTAYNYTFLKIKFKKKTSNELRVCYGRNLTIRPAMTLREVVSNQKDIFTTKGINGCDSIHTTSIIVIYPTQSNHTFSINEIDDIKLPGGNIFKSVRRSFIDTFFTTSSAGCDSLIISSVFVKRFGDTCNIYIPNTFTPNSDFNNNVFKIKGRCILSFRAEIFDQGGALISTSTDMENVWDGKDKEGRDMPINTYAYRLVFITEKNKNLVKLGFITLIR